MCVPISCRDPARAARIDAARRLCRQILRGRRRGRQQGSKLQTVRIN